MRVVLISTYELGRQPFGLASPAAWLREAGHEVACLDLSLQRLDESTIRDAGLAAFHLPMHTATRIAARAARKVRAINPAIPLCFYGLYAPMNEPYLRALGAETILGGEFEEGLVSLAGRLAYGGPRRVNAPQPEPVVSTSRQSFLTPDRSGLPPLHRYARLAVPGEASRVVGYTEASRGCKHLCRHCPIVPVYQGRFRVVGADAVLADIGEQVSSGARHVTFGDPDFFNAIGHATQIIRRLHREHTSLTYDVTIKIEHLLAHRKQLPALSETGCLFVTTAVESVDDEILRLLDKGHTRRDFIEAVGLCADAGVTLHPTFVPFTPWTSIEGYLDLLRCVEELDLVEQVAPIQLAIRLLIPAGSKLLELPQVRDLVAPFDQEGLIHPWHHPDPRVDALHAQVHALVQTDAQANGGRSSAFARVVRLAEAAAGRVGRAGRNTPRPDRASLPYLTEPWYC
ncbi:MAG TPA: CUAEP/CCAEP-tail radical SAM protein [Candidatus Polarisedimenticolia bacterium]|nr:CUAEP/CCAEP-tail radical SAM protein [Candidatus Polarisedimenticolia bacterium]